MDREHIVKEQILVGKLDLGALPNGNDVGNKFFIPLLLTAGLTERHFRLNRSLLPKLF